MIVKNHFILKELIKFIGLVDFFHSCGLNAIENQYYRPVIHNESFVEFNSSRHPVIEQKVGKFVQNDIFFDKNQRIIFITGPNMAGKSTILRQIALTVLMAQVGMFVSCKLKYFPFSSLFVRIGAEDRLHEGQSTFKVEMMECAEALNESNENSLIIMDEVGRGTSTQDGMSISLGIIEYIHDRLRCFALISTHYTEMTEISTRLTAISNYCMGVIVKEEQIIFSYELNSGVAEKSFGIHVAEQSNLPKIVIQRSKEYLKQVSVQISIYKN
jgi:DNA mismatch repair protein MutS